MKKLLLSMTILLSTSTALALECDSKFRCKGHGVSKQDIRTISAHLSRETFNGQEFNLNKVRRMFKRLARIEDVGHDDEDKYSELRREFRREFGDTAKSALLFTLAKAEHYIEKFEDDLGHEFTDTDRVLIPDQFLGNGHVDYILGQAEKSCYVKYKAGPRSTNCTYHPKTGPLASFIITVATGGRYSGVSQDSTTCMARQQLQALVKTVYDGEVVIHVTDIEARGESYHKGRKVIKRPLRVEARQDCEAHLNQLEDEVMLNSCERQ